MLDVFKDPANGFDTISMTAAINTLPYAPARLGQMNLFTPKPISTTVAMVERRHGKLYVLPVSPRGTMETVRGGDKRDALPIKVPHIQENSTVLADDVQGIRAFGSESDVEGVQQLVNDRMTMLRQDHELTWEWHRIGAIKGEILDNDGSSVVLDIFDTFGVTPSSVAFDFTDEDSVKLQAQAVLRLTRDALGMQPFTRVHALCSNDFFDALVTSAAAKDAFNRWQDGAFYRQQQSGPGGFEWAGVVWENYDGTFGSTTFLGGSVARFFPIGVPDLFQHVMAPADFIEAVNTLGRPLYAKQEVMKWDVGVELHTQSNPLMICTRPAVLIEGTIAGSGSSS